MDKDATLNQKKGAKMKKKQPLKVVYITNPIKFKTSASEFRSLVQELTGQDSDLAESSAKFAAEETEKTEAVNRPTTVHALEDVSKIGQHIHDVLPQGSDPSSFGSFSDPSSFGSFVNDVYAPQMAEDFQGLVDSAPSREASSHFDVLRRLDSM